METKDTLTGLFNKWGFFFRVQEILKQKNNKKYQIICFDVKRFKLINDLFGFSAGDGVLKKIADSLFENRTEDGVFARIDSDKFGVFCRKKNAQRIIRMLTEMELYVEGSSTYLVRISMGVYKIDDKTIPVSLMYDRAKMALDTIKEDRVQQVAYFKETMREKMVNEQVLYNELYRAIKNEEMIIYLQGLYNAEKKIVGAEALVRWKHPVKGILSAGMFVEDLEKDGLIVALDQYIWELACKQLQKWSVEGNEDLFLSVNVSAKDFESIDVCETLLKLVKKYNILPEKLRIEITETTLMDDVDRNLKVIDKLQENGFIVEIDDFGSGYSSLNMLKDICADVVKLDMKFLQKAKDEERSKIILRTMVDLVKKLKMQVVVEGVETEEQFVLLKEYNCDLFQGYYLMHPESIEAFEDKLHVQKITEEKVCDFTGK